MDQNKAFEWKDWLLGKIQDLVTGEFDLGQWLSDNIDPFFGGIFDVGEWLANCFECCNRLAGKSTLREIGRALHIKKDMVAIQLLFDSVIYFHT